MKSFKVWTEELTHEDVTICWEASRKIAKQDIAKFELTVIRVGKTDSVKSFNKHGPDTEKEVFKTQIGDPVLNGAAVEVKVLKHLKDDKVIVFKKKRRKGYRVKNGHRQSLTEILVEKIIEKGAKKSSEKDVELKESKPAAKKPAAKKPAAKKPAAKKPAAKKPAAKKPAAIKTKKV